MDSYHLTPEAIAQIAKGRAFIPDDAYPQVQKWAYTPTADFVVTRLVEPQKKEFLLVRRKERPWKDQFFIPGGRIRPGETSRPACVRNMKRELGLEPAQSELKWVDEFAVYNPESQADDGGGWFSQWHLYEYACPAGTVITLDDKGSEFKWFDAIEPDFPDPVVEALQVMGFLLRQ